MRLGRAGIKRREIAAPALQRGAPCRRAARDRRQCRRPRGRTHRFRTWRRAGRAAGCACRYRMSCARRVRRPGWARSLKHPAAFAQRRKNAGRNVAHRRAARRSSVTPATAGTDRCTRSLNGSRSLSMPREPMRQGIDDGDFQAEPGVGDRGGEAVAFAQQPFGALGEPMQAIEQRRRCPRGAELLRCSRRRRRARLAEYKHGRDCDSRPCSPADD